MPIKSYRRPLTGFVTLKHYADSQNNRHPLTGKIDVNVQGRLEFQRGVNVRRTVGFIRPHSVDPFDALDAEASITSWPPSYKEKLWSRLRAEARARFDGKVKYGKADLGVTLGSWRQSWDMIAKRGQQASRSLDKAHKRLSERLNNSQRLERHRDIQRRERELRRWKGDNNYLETPANLVLEGEFGWLPLFSDARNAFGVMSKPSPNGWVSARAKTSISDSLFTQGPPKVAESWSGSAQCTLCANVEVSNPNIWLANQLGLLNGPGVAWDLVPWSFVVNMFTNLGQIANSVTSYYGLEMENTSITESLHYLRDEVRDWDLGGTSATSSNNVSLKWRTPGSIPMPPFYFRMPELNVELALIAVSLAIQQVTKITRLLR